MKFRLLHIICVSASCLLGAMTAGCRNEDKPVVDVTQADALYEELLAAYRCYGDSLSMLPAQDTTGRERGLEERFEQCLRDIYKRYPADLDMHITQVQNDSLWHYTDLYVKARQRHHKPTQVPDTLNTVQPDTLTPATRQAQ